MKNLHYLQQEAIDEGNLNIRVRDKNTGGPIDGAKVFISYTGDPTSTIEQLESDNSGNVESVTLSTPPLEYSMEPSEMQPYAEYTVQVRAEGYREVTINGISVMSDQTSLQEVDMNEVDTPGNPIDEINIPANTLYGNFPEKIPEDEIKSVSETGEIVLSRVVIPEYVVVHDGVPNDSTAMNYYIKYKDYIKNVASSEIYATWPDATIRANILAIMSFTLNRVYTEWYRGKGKNFTITSSTAFDQKFVYGRNTFTSIANVVNEMFENYLSRPNVRQPILTQYCDGQRVSCPRWLSQWGSKQLGDQGYSAIEILRYYYGSNMYINTADAISGIPASWPGYDLRIGSTGSQNYPAIPRLNPDGIYGKNTEQAVRKFQSVFGLPVTGVVDYKTWYAISDIYVAVSRIAELS